MMFGRTGLGQGEVKEMKIYRGEERRYTEEKWREEKRGKAKQGKA
jgi:hypothetical protein